VGGGVQEVAPACCGSRCGHVLTPPESATGEELRS
jgi:hypothetical protein